jgi:hypothetical protein
MQLYLQHIACDRRPVWAGDHMAWPRPAAYTLRDRTVGRPPSPVPGGPPITLGRDFNTLLWVPEPKGGWPFPILHEHITIQATSFDKTSE